MNFSIEQRDNVAILKSHVEKLDALQAPDLKAQLVLLGKSGTTNIVLDLSETRYCDSSGLSAVLVGKRLCTDVEGSFVVRTTTKCREVDFNRSITPCIKHCAYD